MVSMAEVFHITLSPHPVRIDLPTTEPDIIVSQPDPTLYKVLFFRRDYEG